MPVLSWEIIGFVWAYISTGAFLLDESSLNKIHLGDLGSHEDAPAANWYGMTERQALCRVRT
jgi:hypothetical protein